MLHFFIAHLLAISLVGIGLNLYCVKKTADEQPNGAMGMGPLVLFALIPYVMSSLMLFAYLAERWSKWLYGIKR